MSDFEHALKNAHAWVEKIEEMLHDEEGARNASEGEEEAEQAIFDSPLCVEVERRYVLLLTTGGPALRIVGSLDEYDEPATAVLEAQDWGTPWTRVPLSGVQDDTLLAYARHFCFEGME
jgi:hypothetical protein